MAKAKAVNVKRFQYRWCVNFILFGQVEETEYVYGKKEAVRKILTLMNERWAPNRYNVTERRKGYVRYAPIKDEGVYTLEQVENPHWSGKVKAPAKPKVDPDRDPNSDERKLRLPGAVEVDMNFDELTVHLWTPNIPKFRRELPLDEQSVYLIMLKLRSFSGKRYRFLCEIQRNGRVLFPIIQLPAEEQAWLLRMGDEQKQAVTDALAWRSMLETKAEATKVKNIK